MTLVGVILAVPGINKLASTYAKELVGLFAGFSAGALLACAFFLLLFEATHYVASGWPDPDQEVDVLWRWGTMILAGFFLPAFLDIIVAVVFMASGEPQKAAETNDDPESYKDSSKSSRARLFAGVIIGDFFHNLCDGFFLGAAFKGCGDKFGWGVALGTVLHELPQEIADYTILTGPGLGLSPVLALLFNFLSGLSVILGAIIIMSAEIPNSSIGLLLAFGGGVYLHIAATECMPRIYNENLSIPVRIGCMAAFVVGAILIGLVLLDHEHCSAGGEGGGDGHHHH